jgi:hypothetical protein
MCSETEESHDPHSQNIDDDARTIFTTQHAHGWRKIQTKTSSQGTKYRKTKGNATWFLGPQVAEALRLY